MEPIMSLIDQFETIADEHYEALFKFAMSLTRGESDGEDLEILLPADCDAAARKTNETSSGPMADEPAAPSESAVRPLRSDVPLAASAEHGYAEWDLSSTLLPELSGPRHAS
jgi:hypothetical protein